MTQVIDSTLIEPLCEEDLSRAQWYGLVARLFSSPLDVPALRSLAAALPEAQSGTQALGQAFADLCRAASQTTAEAVKAEFDAVFVGTGKAEIFLNASFYQAGFLHEKPLVDLRSALDRLGYARNSQVADTEDHLSVLCSTLQQMILDRVPLHEQTDLFRSFVADWFEQAVEAVERSGNTDFYKHAARLAGVFLAIERQSFDFED